MKLFLKIAILSLIFLSIVIGLTVSANADSNVMQNLGNGHFYQRIDTHMWWDDAKIYCEDRGGYLATLSSQNEDQFVYNNLVINSISHACWLGGTDEVVEGTWQWITGETWNYTHWYSGEPNNCGGAEDYLWIYQGRNGTWNDNKYDASSCSGSPNQFVIYTICEWDPAAFNDFFSFPLRGYAPYNAPISSVFDHSMSSSYAKDSVVVAYTDEKGNNQKYSSSCDCYNKTDGYPFNINNHYTGASTCGKTYYLCYDGHPGIDYPVPNNTPVYAVADGIAHLPASFPGVSNAQNYNTIEINHQNGYKTYYLHLSQQLVLELQSVTRGQLIGYSGDVGSPGAYHLHFEVQKNVNGVYVPVDPYGWEGSGNDPYTRATNINLWANFDNDNDGYTSDVDCDDNDQAINPGASEICNGIDDNCNGQIDEGGTCDLIVSSLTSPTTGIPGSTINITDTTKNQGTGTTSASTTKLYWSTNSTWDAGDTYLGARPVPALAAGTTNSGSTTVTVPAGACSGTFYIIAKADADNVVAETKETNNTKYKTIKAGTDLIIYSLTAPTTSGAGKTITVGDTTKNQGGCLAGASTTKLYFSTNSTWDAADTYLGERAVPALAALATSTGSTSVTIPASATTGTRYIIAKADANAVVTETSETNNKKSKSIKIGPDLIVSLITAPTSAVRGSTISVTDTTKNNGGGDAGASTTKLYVSTNTTWDAGDTYLGSRSVPMLAAGASSAGSTSVTIPSGIATGPYYIIALTDDGNVVVETNEINNKKTKAITINP